MHHTPVIPASLARSPIVAVLGHVDHGKTTLLDAIRNTQITAKEHGGITQHIGAYEVELPQKLAAKNKYVVKTITFIDTPGHQAFARMRVRGATVADIAILVVAANDGVKPQTVESVNHIKAANIPLVVAINKIDLPDIHIDKIKQQLVKLGLKLEEYGGETPLVPISAKNGRGIEKLLEMILVLAELHNVKQENTGFKGVIIESLLSKSKGAVATVVVRSGGIKIGDDLIADTIRCRVRAIMNWKGMQLRELKGGQAGELLGWQKVPAIGSVVLNVKEGMPAIKHLQEATSETVKQAAEVSVDEKMKIILRADTAGTLEAIISGLPHDVIEVLASSVGSITESDILLAKTAKAIVVGFQIKPADSVLRLAMTEKVIVKIYQIIYELFDELKEVATALKEGNLVEVLGESKVIALFPFNNDTVAGIKVMSGRIARGDQVKVVREDTEIGRARIKSLRHAKDDINKAEQGTEAGLILSQKLDILTGDSIISIG